MIEEFFFEHPHSLFVVAGGLGLRGALLEFGLEVGQGDGALRAYYLLGHRNA